MPVLNTRLRRLGRWSIVVTCQAFIIAICCLAAPVFGAPYGHQTAFRYRCFEDNRPAWVSSLNAGGGIDHSNGSVDIHVIDRGAGFDRMISADFNGVSEYIGATNSVNTVDTAGHDSFTIQAWFFAHQTDGYRTLVSNTENNRGFSLKIRDGTLRGLVRFDHDGSPRHVETTGGNVTPNQWHSAALRVKEDGDIHRLELFLDGSRVSYWSVPSYDGIRQSSEPPMVGAEPTSGAGTSNFFDGYIYAVSITNYAVGKVNFLENQGIRDASRYFGMPSYHDYLDTRDGSDHRVSATINSYPDVENLIRGRWYVPFSNDQYIPQGVASDGADLLYLSMYWKETDADGPDRPHSIVVEATTTGELRRVFQLKNFASGSCSDDVPKFTGHVGGLAFWNGFIYVPNGRNVLRYELPAGGPVFDPETFANASFDNLQICADAEYLDPLAVCTTDTSISYLSIGKDWEGNPVLWMGTFEEDYITSVIGFSIDPATGHLDPSSPVDCFDLAHTKVQGIYPYRMTPHTVGFYVATSYGDNPSYIHDVVYSRSTGELLTDPSAYVFEGPAGIEDLAMVGADLWTVSESGAKFYQKVREWDDMFPFVFKIDTNEFPVTTDVALSLAGTDNLRITNVFPNPFNPRTTIAFETLAPDHVRVDILNLRGELVATLLDRQLAAGLHQLDWNGRNNFGGAVSSGTYFVQVHDSRGESSRRMTLIR